MPSQDSRGQKTNGMVVQELNDVPRTLAVDYLTESIICL